MDSRVQKRSSARSATATSAAGHLCYSVRMTSWVLSLIIDQTLHRYDIFLPLSLGILRGIQSFHPTILRKCVSVETTLRQCCRFPARLLARSMWLLWPLRWCFGGKRRAKRQTDKEKPDTGNVAISVDAGSLAENDLTQQLWSNDSLGLQFESRLADQVLRECLNTPPSPSTPYILKHFM